MQETFAHWSLQDWTSALTEQGFSVLYGNTYTSDWIKRNRWDGIVKVLDPSTQKSIATPTNIVIVGVKQ
jgi:hypothetical protein